MNVLVTLFLYLACSGHGESCKTIPFVVTREAAAIAACESGDGRTFGTHDRYARSKTSDGGLFQFNDRSYKLWTGRTHAENDSPEFQYDLFIRIWDNGKGWRHWKASQHCWSQWMEIQDGVAVWKDA